MPQPTQRARPVQARSTVERMLTEDRRIAGSDRSKHWARCDTDALAPPPFQGGKRGGKDRPAPGASEGVAS
jgi:hypothetical protein